MKKQSKAGFSLVKNLTFPFSFLFFKTACFAIGNAAYHSDSLYTALSPAIPMLVDLLTDSVARTRANAAGKEHFQS